MSYLSTVQGIRGGSLLVSLDEKLAAVLDGIEETGKKGAITLKLNIKKNGKGAVDITPSVQADIPEPDIGGSTFFIVEGKLSRKDPRQMDFVDELQVKRNEKESG